MTRLLKYLLIALAAVVALLVAGAAALLLFFDPNDFRDEIAAEVSEATGRELTIEGEISLSLFPWFAVEVGRTSLGNAPGFGDEPFARFERARLSVRLLPLLLRRDVAVGTAALDALELNLAVDAGGVANWDDLAAAPAAGPAPAAEPAETAGPTGLDVASVEVTGATVRYRDAAAGSRYALEELSLTAGRIAFEQPFDVASEFDFRSTADELSGHVALRARLSFGGDFSRIAVGNFALEGELAGIAAEPAAFAFEAERLDVDLDEQRVVPGPLALTALGVTMEVEVEPFSWAGEPSLQAALEVAAFSPRRVMGLLGIEAPETADPAALDRLSLSATAMLGDESLAFRNLAMRLDDTALDGELVLPLAGDAPIRFELAADRVDLDRYMAPPAAAGEAAPAAAGGDDFELPVELVRELNARGNLTLARAELTGMVFENLELGLTSGGGQLRLNPLAASLFGGSYSGDVQLDASGETPSLSVNERVTDVSLTPLAQAMFGRDDISGTINGSFVLETRGATLAAMRRALGGNMTFELADGAWEGVDIWHRLRTARALYRRETPPEPRRPARTDFSSVVATGTVTDGVFQNNDLIVEMPFLRVTGSGTVDLAGGDIDYALRARVLERPEFLSGASDEELAEFTEALIPVRVRGTLADPSVRPDIEAVFRDRVDETLERKGEELKQRLLERLLPQDRRQEEGSAPPADGERQQTGAPQADEQQADEQQADEQQTGPEEELENLLKDMLER